MIKKFLAVSMLLLAAITLSACAPKEFTVTFDSQGGDPVDAVVVEEGLTVAEPTAPTKSGDGTYYTFVGWYTDEALTNLYDFATEVTADVTLYAKYVTEVVLHFDTKVDGISVEPMLLGENGGNADAPAAPTRDGYTFEGWYMTKRGHYWLEDTPVEFPYAVTEETTLYAYWEPVDSKAVDYDDAVTYTTTIDDESTIVLNPMTYEWSHESAYVDMMVTDLYSTEVDWDKAIEEGVASEVLDFSKILDGTYSIDALDYVNVLEGAAAWPADSDGDQHLDEDGNYDRDNATKTTDTSWTFTIRDDLYWETGENITAVDYEYTLKMFLDPLLNNKRANIFYKLEGARRGTPITGAYEYYAGEGDWADVGFEIDPDDPYTFTISFWEPVTQSSAVGTANSLRLIHRASFEASLDAGKTNSSYGTPLNPFVSYGEYVMKTWDANQKIVFNKNFDYVGKDNINYKCYVVEVVQDLETRMQLFEQGKLSVTGLSKSYYNTYAEEDNVFESWGGYPQYIMINTAESSQTENANVHPTIMFDVRFRQALLYGFDRKYYANNVYQPNVPSLLPIPLDTKIYLQDLLYFSESPQFAQVLEDLNITEGSEGFLADRAVTLFNQAYDAWVAEGNTGPVELRLVASNDDFTKDLVDYIESSYEDLFNTIVEDVNQMDKIDIQVDYMEASALDVATATLDYDLFMTNVGFGSSTGAHWQFPPLNFWGGFYWSFLGLYQPFDMSTESGYADWWSEEIEIDLTYAYNYMTEYTVESMTADGLEDWLAIYDLLVYDDGLCTQDDIDAGDVMQEDGVTPCAALTDRKYAEKAAGLYRGPLSGIAFTPYTDSCPWDATATEPYAGAMQDMWNMTAAFSKVYLENAISVPTVTRASATLYADNVKITWPLYSVAFGWGSQRYRWLTTDPDFME